MQPLFENDGGAGGMMYVESERRVTLFDLFAHLGFALNKSSEYNKMNVGEPVCHGESQLETFTSRFLVQITRPSTLLSFTASSKSHKASFASQTRMNATGFIQYLQQNPPAIPLQAPLIAIHARNEAYSWQDIESIGLWQDFNINTIWPRYQNVLYQTPTTHDPPAPPPEKINAENGLRHRVTELVSRAICRALRVFCILQGEQCHDRHDGSWEKLEVAFVGDFLLIRHSILQASMAWDPIELLVT